MKTKIFLDLPKEDGCMPSAEPVHELTQFENGRVFELSLFELGQNMKGLWDGGAIDTGLTPVGEPLPNFFSDEPLPNFFQIWT